MNFLWRPEALYLCLPLPGIGTWTWTWAIGLHSTEMPITATVCGFAWTVGVSVRVSPCLAAATGRVSWRGSVEARKRAIARRQGAFNQCYCRLSKSLAATSYHSQATICHSSGEQETPLPMPLLLLLDIVVVVVVVIKTRAEIYDSVRIQLQFGLSV